MKVIPEGRAIMPVIQQADLQVKMSMSLLCIAILSKPGKQHAAIHLASTYKSDVYHFDAQTGKRMAMQENAYCQGALVFDCTPQTC